VLVQVCEQPTEVAAGGSAADQFEKLGQVDQAERLRSEAAVLREYLRGKV
jgi:hypothetical protein